MSGLVIPFQFTQRIEVYSFAGRKLRNTHTISGLNRSGGAVALVLHVRLNP
jgi:hypothetical protein